MKMTFPITPTTARLIEVAEVAFINAQIQGARQLFPNDGFLAEPVGGGVAAVTKLSFGRKLNHVAGFGMDGTVTENGLGTIERLYEKIGVPPEINLCPFAHPSAMEVLNARGYKICAEMNVYAISLAEYKTDSEDGATANGKRSGDNASETTISHVTPEEHGTFIELSSAGFQSGNPQSDLFHTLAGTATIRPDTRLYFARINGQIAGTAGMAILNTPLGRVAELYIDSTVPDFRGKGIQLALLRARLAEAKDDGCELAAVTTWPTGTSARNVERAGFRLAYKKDVYTM
jgi:GNAT superfamily N-acetyltransferase